MSVTPGQEFELKVTPDRYLTVRYAGASGDFNPIHIDEEFAQQVGLPGRILHGLWTMAQVARAHTEALGGPDKLERLSVQFRGMGMLEQEITVHGTVASVERRARASSTSEAEQGGKRIIRNGEAEIRAGLSARLELRWQRPITAGPYLQSVGDVDRTPRAGAAPARRGAPRRRRRPWAPRRSAPRSNGARRRSATSWPTSRSWGCSPTRTPRPAGCPPRPATATSSTACCRPSSPGPGLSLSLVRRELDEAMRVTTETLSQVTDLLAIVSAPPIETSTIRHIEVLALQPQVLMVVVITSTGGVSKRLFTFARPVDTGLADWAASYLNERLVGPRARRADAPPAPARPLAERHRAGVPGRAGPGVHRARGVGPGDPVRGGRRDAADGRAVRRRVRPQPADGHARAPRGAARGAALGAQRPPRRRRPDRRRERDPGAALAGAGRGQLRAAPAQPRRGVGDRARCGWTTAARSAPCARPPRSCRASSPTCTTRR